MKYLLSPSQCLAIYFALVAVGVSALPLSTARQYSSQSTLLPKSRHDEIQKEHLWQASQDAKSPKSKGEQLKKDEIPDVPQPLYQNQRRGLPPKDRSYSDHGHSNSNNNNYNSKGSSKHYGHSSKYVSNYADDDSQIYEPVYFNTGKKSTSPNRDYEPINFKKNHKRSYEDHLPGHVDDDHGDSYNYEPVYHHPSETERHEAHYKNGYYYQAPYLNKRQGYPQHGQPSIPSFQETHHAKWHNEIHDDRAGHRYENLYRKPVPRPRLSLNPPIPSPRTHF